MTGYCEAISLDSANSDGTLKSIAAQKLGGDEGSFEITPWINHNAKLIPDHTKDRLVVFKPPENTEKLGCIRVRDKDNIHLTLWDIVQKSGLHVGLVPAGCKFEAMVVDTKIITPK